MHTQPTPSRTLATRAVETKGSRPPTNPPTSRLGELETLRAFQKLFSEARQKVIAVPGFVDRLRSIPQARDVLGGISHGKFYGEVAAGRLPLTKIGARSFVADSDLSAYLTASRQAPVLEEAA